MPQKKNFMKWHPFRPAQEYSVPEVLAVLRRDIASGRIKDVDAKIQILDQLERHRDIVAVFSPFGGGWGMSPYNPRAWKRTDGSELFSNLANPSSGQIDRNNAVLESVLPKARRTRKALSRADRRSIHERTDGRCYSCGLPMALEDDWWIEHILPHSREGSNEVPNLLPSCRLCNFVRSNRTPTEIRKMLNIGYVLAAEVRKNSQLGRAVIAHLDKREARLKKTRKHAVLAMNEDIRNTIRSHRIDSVPKLENCEP
jgi:5-methylcytosine-specific restriction endonuclease McrA